MSEEEKVGTAEFLRVIYQEKVLFELGENQSKHFGVHFGGVKKEAKEFQSAH